VRIEITSKMKTKHLPLLAPGEMQNEEFLEPMNLTAYRLAKDIGVPLTRITAIPAGKRVVSADAGLQLDLYFGLTLGKWLHLHTDCDLREAKHELAAKIDH